MKNGIWVEEAVFEAQKIVKEAKKDNLSEAKQKMILDLLRKL